MEKLKEMTGWSLAHRVPAMRLYASACLFACCATAWSQQEPIAILYTQLNQVETDLVYDTEDTSLPQGEDRYASEVADDFVPTESGWVIYGIQTRGSTTVGGGATVDLSIRPGAGGEPHASIDRCSYANLTPIETSPGSFNVPLPYPCLLKGSGTHWLTLQTNQDVTVYGEHYVRLMGFGTGPGDPAVFRNPNKGVTDQCPDWAPMSTCGVVTGQSESLAFALSGRVAAPKIYGQPTLGNPGPHVPHQDFPNAHSTLDSLAADDFTIDDPYGWRIQRVDVSIAGSEDPSATFDVKFYANNLGGGNPDLPGDAVCSYADLSPLPDTYDEFVFLDLPTNCDLIAGTYWISVEANQDNSPPTQRFWRVAGGTGLGSEAVWRNPSNGYLTDCLDWSPVTSCNVNGVTQTDLGFELRGRSLTIFRGDFETGDTQYWSSCAGCS